MRSEKQTRQRGLSWAPVLFLLAFLVALGIIALEYLEPMLRAASTATTVERKQLSAFSLLALMVMVAALLIGVVLTVRIGRNIAKLAEQKRKPTVYPDVWEESARRIKTPTPEELEGKDEEDKA